MIVRNDIPDHKLVLGCTRDAQIHVGTSAFQLYASGLHAKLITLAEVKFMVACNAGPQWERLLASQPIFGFDENDAPCFVAGGLIIPKELAAVPVEPVSEPVAEVTPESQPADETGDCAVNL